MLLGTHQKLAELIIHIFRLVPFATANEIFERITKVRSITHRAVFKELSSLVEQGVLVRVKGNYTIKVTWILELLQLGEELSTQSLRPQSLDLQIPKPGEKLRWRFSSIRRMDIFWVQLMFVLYSISPTKRMYGWYPHFWFHLLDLKKEFQAMRAMHKGGNKHHLIIGSKSYIDLLPTQYWNKKVYEWSYAPELFNGEHRHYLDLIDDFILTVVFSPRFVTALDALCAKVRNRKDLEAVHLQAFFDVPSPVTLTLEHSQKKAQRLRRKFIGHFGHM